MTRLNNVEMELGTGLSSRISLKVFKQQSTSLTAETFNGSASQKVLKQQCLITSCPSQLTTLIITLLVPSLYEFMPIIVLHIRQYHTTLNK